MAMDPKQEEQLKKQYLDSIDRVEEEDVDYAFKKGSKKAERLSDSVPDKLKALWDDLRTMLAMLGDYRTGRYRDVPWKSIAAIAGAVIYFVSPIDVIPDFIPFVGYLDDAYVITLAVSLVRDDLQAYREWKAGQGDAP